MKEHKLNKFSNFIHGLYLDDTTICDDIIEYHSIGNQITGTVGGLNGIGIDKNVKDSIDVILKENKTLYDRYVKQLDACVLEYIKQYEYAGTNHFYITEPIGIQKYNPTGGYKLWHSERVTSNFPQTTRHLVFMTYLNDVADEGETEFYYQKLKVRPEKGLTLIWPADWTFTHRGIPSMSETKYIVTGWYNYLT